MLSTSPQNERLIWQCGDMSHDLTERGMVMGILNVTPDSFSDGGAFNDDQAAVEHALQMVNEGAGMIDIGGESTRPGAEPVGDVEEMSRVLPVIEALSNRSDVTISIDTTKARVAEAALNAGASVVNDVTGGTRDEDMIKLWQRKACGIVVMHSQGTPETMQVAPSYENVVDEVMAFFYERHRTLTEAGIAAERIVFDPGIGFGKSLEHNLALLRAVQDMDVYGRPVLMGVSRKSFIGKLLDDDAIELRDWPTVALTAKLRGMGARVFRVHDVRRNVESLRMAEAILHA